MRGTAAALMRAGGLVALLLVTAAAGRPGRIVSINPCVDAILMQVADPAQIAGISHYSQDPRTTSMPLTQAARFTATSGTAEEVVALAPDVVISGPHVEPATVNALRRLGIPLVQVGVPDTIAQSRAQVRAIAAAAGHQARGEQLVARIDAAVAAARAGGPPVPALIWLGGGLVPGSATLADDMMRASGFHNVSADYGLKVWDVLPLEQLLARPPRVLLTTGDIDASDRMLGHPALRHLDGRVAVRAWPQRLLNCGGPTIIEAVDRLAAVRRGL
jgi:iron complex transport system substrate-binding protein